MKAYLKNYRQSPRKVRLVADMIRGKEVSRALSLLRFADKKSAPALAKLLNSAVHNAEARGAARDSLFVQKILVDQGVVMRRYMPGARGSAHPYQKKTSCISIELGSHSGAKTEKTKKSAAEQKTKATPKPRAAKKVAKK